MRFAEHMIAGAEEYGYQPSEWLRVVREAADDPLSFNLGTLAVPIPVRQYPAAPVLHDQTATQAKRADVAGSDPLAPYLHWDYGAGLTLPEALPQDALWLDVTYNAPVAPTPRQPTADVPNLFQALAAFNVAWPVLGTATCAGWPTAAARPSTASTRKPSRRRSRRGYSRPRARGRACAGYSIRGATRSAPPARRPTRPRRLSTAT